MPVRGLNHAVLYVRDALRHAAFYQEVLGFEVGVLDPQGRFAFMRAAGSPNDHDIAFFTIGAEAGPSAAGRGTVGLYHLAWEVATLAELADLRQRLADADALVGMSDHGTSKSLYAHDPDGLEFEVMWEVPARLLDEGAQTAMVAPLDLDAELARYGATTPGGRTS